MANQHQNRDLMKDEHHNQEGKSTNDTFKRVTMHLIRFVRPVHSLKNYKKYPWARKGMHFCSRHLQSC